MYWVIWELFLEAEARFLRYRGNALTRTVPILFGNRFSVRDLHREGCTSPAEQLPIQTKAGRSQLMSNDEVFPDRVLAIRHMRRLPAIYSFRSVRYAIPVSVRNEIAVPLLPCVGIRGLANGR